jgi:hypothetical protein
MLLHRFLVALVVVVVVVGASLSMSMSLSMICRSIRLVTVGRDIQCVINKIRIVPVAVAVAVAVAVVDADADDDDDVGALLRVPLVSFLQYLYQPYRLRSFLEPPPMVPWVGAIRTVVRRIHQSIE